MQLAVEKVENQLLKLVATEDEKCAAKKVLEKVIRNLRKGCETRIDEFKGDALYIFGLQGNRLL